MDKKEQITADLKELRKEIFIVGYKGGMAHLASCYSALEIIYSMYCGKILHLDERNPKWVDRDRFVLSKGHAGLALYAVLKKCGLISDEMLHSYLKKDALIGGEPCMRDCQWVEATTGSLGHGLSTAVGMAIALKINRSHAKVYCLLGDGELEEGTIWEAAMSASAFQLDNMIAILDHNEIQKMDKVDNIIGLPHWREKWEAFGWQVLEVDGHDAEKFSDVVRNISSSKPTIVIAHTVKGKGVSIMEDNPNWHFRLPKKKELRTFMEELDISIEELE